MRKDTPDVNGFKNLRLFRSENDLSAKMDGESVWFIDSGASAHMSCNRECYQLVS